MEFKNMQAKFNLTVNIVLKTNIVKEAQKLNLDIDDVLDNYISDENNLKQIHDLVEESLHSDLEIESINFVKNETLINAYNDSCLYITCECIVNAEKLVCVNKEIFSAQDYLENSCFWFNKNNLSVTDYILKSAIA